MAFAKPGGVLSLALSLALALLWCAGPARADTVTFEQNANGQPQFLPGNTGTTPSFNFPDDNNWNQVLVTGSGEYKGQTYTYTEQPSNWSTDNGTYPDSGSTDVLIDGLPVTLNVNVTVDNLTLSNGAVIDIQGGNTLNVDGALTDNGSLVVNFGADNTATVLNFAGGTVSGSGAIILNNGYDGGGNAQLTGTLTQASGHTISGQGLITAALTNYGLVNADINDMPGGNDVWLYLSTNNMTNKSVMEASNGGVLDIIGVTITQGTNAQILANGGNVQFDGSPTVSGGFLNSSGSASVFNVEGTADATFNALTNNAPVNVLLGGVLNITNGIVDNGSISVNPGSGNGDTVLNFAGGTVSGTGTIFLDNGYDGGGNAQLTGTLTQASGHTISGQGLITAALTNNGLVNADVPGGSDEWLYLSTNNMTNKSVMEASNGGVLDIIGITITQGTNAQILANGGNVQFDSATVSAGTLNSSTSTSVFTVNSGAVTLKSVTDDAPINMANGTTLNITAGMVDNATITMAESTAVNVTGNLTGNGSILAGDGGNTMSFGGGTVSGTGTIALDETQVSGALTQSAGHTISGSGGIDGGFTNSGLLNADVYNQTLTLSGSNMFNNGIMESSGGGNEVLEISGITITQGTNGELFANGGNVQFDGATGVIGGALDSSTSTSVFIVNSGTSTFNSVTNDAPVNIVAGSKLNITGSLTDNGSIEVNSNDSGAVTDLNFAGGTVTGSGTIILNAGNPYAQLTGALTQAAGHSIIGFGVIDAGLTNNGLVNADVYNEALYLTGSNMTNSGVMESTTGGGAGVLDISGITVTQGTNGKLLANGGNVQFDSATVSGGALNSNGSSLFVLNSGTSVFHSLTNNATVNMTAGTTLNITGSLTDNGSIVVDSGNNSTLTVLDIGGGMVSGSGSIILNANYGDAQLTGALTQGAGHTISGFGYIVAALINDGLVNASVYNEPLYLTGNNMTNNGVMESTTGGGAGVLDISGITVTQGTNGKLLANGGNVQFDSATVSGGALNSNGSSLFVLNSGTSVFHSLTNNATVNMTAGTTLNITGSLTDNGSIVVNSGNNGTVTDLNFAGVTVSGSGTIVLNAGNPYTQLTGALTQAAGHSIIGFGVIDAGLTNNGLVNADVYNEALYLTGSNMTNSGVMESTTGGGAGVLDISGITVTQGTNGKLLANGGNVQFDGATKISGGALDSSISTSIFIVNSGTATFASLTNNATVNILAGNALNVSGNLIDNGEIVVNSGGNSSYTAINFGGGTVSGSGAIVLNEPYGDAQVTGTLTQAGSHTISGFGVIAAALANAGTVNADVNNQTLYVDGKTTNSGLMEASGGGTLSFAPGVLTNLAGSTLTSGTYEALAGSTISLSGSITTNSATIILNGAGSTFGAINGIAVNKGEFEVLGGETFDTAGALVNSGAVVTSTAGALAVNGALTEDGSGTLAVTSGGAFSDTSGYIGGGGAGTASATVTGSGSTWTNTGNVAIGYSGTGRLVVTTGGAVSDGGGFIGYAAGSNGGVTVSGSGAKWTTSAGLIVGDLGNGALTITNGGHVGVTGATTLGSLGTFQFDGNSTFSTGSLAVNGGKLVTLGAATFAPSATLGAGGMTVNSEGFSSTFTGNFSGAGGITKSGSGTITLTGASSYTGATSVNAGTLALTTGSAHTASLGNTAITVASGAIFAASAGPSPFSRIVSAGTTASGTAGAILALAAGSTFSMAGSSLATFDLQQESAFSGPAFTIGGASGIAPDLIFNIGNAATGTDLLRVTKTVSVLASGGDITIDPLAGDTSLTAGSYYLIISAGGFSGTGGNHLTLTDPSEVINGTTYDFSLAHSTADDEVLTVSTAPAPGVAPGQSLASSVSSNGDLLANTPAAVPAGAPVASVTMVPEPGATASLLSAFGLAAGWMLRRRKQLPHSDRGHN